MEGKTRVLIIVAGLAVGEPLGGAERFGIELARSLDRGIFEPIVCAFWERGTSAERYWLEQLVCRGVEVFFAAKWAGRFSLSRYAKGIAKIILHFQNTPVALIHSHFQVGSVSALILKNRIGAKAVVRTAHLSPKKEWGKGFNGALCRHIFTRFVFPVLFDAEVGVSKAIVEALDQRLIARALGRKAIFIPNAIYPSKFVGQKECDQNKRWELGLSEDDLVVGSVGRLTEQKGYTFLIDAVPTICSYLPNTKFIIIGEGESYLRLQEQARNLGVADKVIFTGPRQDVECLYKIMDLFVLPSLWEGLPTVVLESMASGVPVVATDIPGTRELITPGYTGWLVRPRDTVSLASTIIYALGNHLLRKEISQRALEVVIPQYSIECIASQYQNLYHRLLLRS